jgi:putative tryptophan/tyrosine transport system substrate-binding protein
MIDRRTFIGSLALGTLAVPRVASAQPARKVAQIGILSFDTPVADMSGPEPRLRGVKALLQGLRELGRVYGRDFVTEPRDGGSNSDLWPGVAAELVRLQVDVIVCTGIQTWAVKQATSTIPIVMAGNGDPVGEGLIQSLAHPGGNITRLTDQSIELFGKRLEMLKELVPSGKSVAWISTPDPDQRFHRIVGVPAGKLGLKVLSFEIRSAGDLEGAFKAAAQAQVGFVLVGGMRITLPNARRVAELAAASQLPAMYLIRSYVVAGGLISYNADIVDMWRRAAVYVDKILKGVKPTDLPVEQANKFDLVINLKTAKALGLTIPPSLLQRADEVIQ